MAESDGMYSVVSSEINCRSDVLMTYINREPQFELQALYAVQAFVHRLQHPPGKLRLYLLSIWFMSLLSRVY